MRPLSAYDMKHAGHCHGNRKDAPRPGSRVRAVYDFLFANAGRWVTVRASDFAGSYPIPVSIEYLRNFYGLDIRCSGRGRGSEIILAGEHAGLAYLDYVADPTLARTSDRAVASGDLGAFG